MTARVPSRRRRAQPIDRKSRGSASRRSAPRKIASAAASCGLPRRNCPLREVCDRDTAIGADSSSENRAAFDSLYERAFARVYRAAELRLRDRALAEAYTSRILKSAFRAPGHRKRCGAGALLRFLKFAGGARGAI